MNTAPSTLRSFLLGRTRRLAPVPDDPADMGTCFGLEMSLRPFEPAPPAPPASHWWQRWGARKPAAV